jgi:hypothetical protein
LGKTNPGDTIFLKSSNSILTEHSIIINKQNITLSGYTDDTFCWKPKLQCITNNNMFLTNGNSVGSGFTLKNLDINYSGGSLSIIDNEDNYRWDSVTIANNVIKFNSSTYFTFDLRGNQYSWCIKDNIFIYNTTCLYVEAGNSLSACKNFTIENNIFLPTTATSWGLSFNAGASSVIQDIIIKK